MRIAIHKPLFAWDCLDDNPTLQEIAHILAAIPDQELLRGLREHRGKGRDDYPCAVLWGVLLLSIILRHPTMDACLDDLQRNDPLCLLIGIDQPGAIPKAWNMSRFLDVLGQDPHRTRLRELFNQLAQVLGRAVPDLGQHTAGDSAHLHARKPAAPADKTSATAAVPPASDKPLSTPTAAAVPPASDKPLSTPTAAAPPRPLLLPDDPNQPIVHGNDTVDAHGLPLPAGGRKEYTAADGLTVEVFQWFGYKLHQLVDVKHEVALAYQLTSPKVADADVLPTLFAQARANLPTGRIRTLAYDKAADDEAVHAFLHDEGVQPLIQIRALWKQDPERMLPGHDGSSNIVYDEAGTVYCYDKVSEPPVRHRMSYIGHEPSRGTLKYRCPAKHEGFDCPMASICNAGKSYGKTVRVPQEIDLRRFPSIPRATKQFERLYKGRTAVERVNARLKIFWGVDDGNVVGGPRMHAHVGAVMVVHLALAKRLAATPRRDGPLGKLRLSPIAEQLQEPVGDS